MSIAAVLALAVLDSINPSAIVVTLIFQIPLGRNASYWDAGSRRALARIIAVASLLLWTGIVFAGRWIAYFDR